MEMEGGRERGRLSFSVEEQCASRRLLWERSIVVDIVDPHGPKWGDTTAKWIGLADYAEKHKAEVGQVVAVIEHKDEYWRLDLRNSTVRDEMKKASSEADVRKIFESYGGKL